jgi:DNA modification methylase
MADIKLIHGDCLIENKQIENGSVDLILTDLPYGTMNGAQLDGWKNQTTDWDNSIDPTKVFEIANRILRKNGKMVLFSQEPYTTQLINNAIANVPFSYRMMWEKDHFANSLIAKKAPVSYFEDILVFSKHEEDKKGHALQEYFYEEYKKSGLTVKEICKKLGTTQASHFFTQGKQFRVPNKKYLKLLQELTGHFNISYTEITEAQKVALEKNRTEFPSTFNLWEGNKYKSNVLKYKKDYNGFHPTQKPVLLLEDLIKTFSNEGDLVVDLTMGSGSTGVACKNTNRDFIGIEKDEGYFKIAQTRIQDAQSQEAFL